MFYLFVLLDDYWYIGHLLSSVTFSLSFMFSVLPPTTLICIGEMKTDLEIKIQAWKLDISK